MAFNSDPDGIIDEILREADKIEPAAEEMRQKVNELIKKYELNSSAAIGLLARISASYVYKVCKSFDTPSSKKMTEVFFKNMFDVYIHHFEFNKELEKIKN